MDTSVKNLSPSEAELIKERSHYLRGTLNESLADPLTGALRPDDQLVVKFHGTYQQQDRDLDDERRRQKLEPLYSFLIRIRVPAGIVTPAQWLAIDEIATRYGDDTLKLTTRQAFELHGVFKRNLKTTMKAINNTLLDTLAACGDVNRNVMASANPYESPVHKEIFGIAGDISRELTPQTGAYHEIWLDGEKKVGPAEEEPLYGKLYLPRKFKIAIAVPPRNDTDVLANDLGFIAIVEKGELKGFNVSVGGGMGMSFGNEKTYPRLGTVIGSVNKNKVVDVAKAVLLVQRDQGNRSDRKNARLKYTIDRMGVERFRQAVNLQLGWELADAQPYTFATLGDRYGWHRAADGQWHFTLFVEGGKIPSSKFSPLKRVLREMAKIHQGQFILTGNQNLVIASVDEKSKAELSRLLSENGLEDQQNYSSLRLNSIACVALPLCGLAFADAERYLPRLIDKIDILLQQYGLTKEEIVIRMTGCPNGCGRPYLSEIGLVGKAPGLYNLYLGAGFAGDRLNKLYKESVNEEAILAELKPLFAAFASERKPGERFGDFVIRKGYIKATTEGKDFHQNLGDIRPVNFSI